MSKYYKNSEGTVAFTRQSGIHQVVAEVQGEVYITRTTDRSKALAEYNEYTTMLGLTDDSRNINVPGPECISRG